MINLRYHVVSLMAVFLALGMGIVMGSTVIDRVTVDALNSRLENVRRSVNGIREQNRTLEQAVRTGQAFADQARDGLAGDSLAGVPVTIVAVTGIDRKPVESLRELIVISGAEFGGTVWVLPRLRLATEGDIKALSDALGLPVVEADTMRRLSLARLLGDTDKVGGSDTLAKLVDAGFVSFDPPPTITATSVTPTTKASGAAAAASTTKTPAPTGVTTTVPSSTPTTQLGAQNLNRPDTRYVVASGAGAEVGDDLLAVPLAQALAATPGRGVAVESGSDTPGGRGVYVGLLRDDANVASRLSTVDNIESSMGQVATVLALAELVESRVGHYGVGPGADRLIPGRL